VTQVTEFFGVTLSPERKGQRQTGNTLCISMATNFHGSQRPCIAEDPDKQLATKFPDIKDEL